MCFRKIKSGAINVHPTEPTLIVDYTVEAIILGESDNPVISDKKVLIFSVLNFIFKKCMFLLGYN